MSQVDKFNQLNNPDYVYFDLQQTNIYNATTQEQQPLKFLETRETPVIKNTGDYYMSVARFQLDTYNLPVIVGEPDLTQTGTFDPDKTIYKVAMNITNGAFTTTETITPTNYTLTSEISRSVAGFTEFFGAQVKTANVGTKENICVAVSDYSYEANKGRVFIWKGIPASNSIAHQLICTTPSATNLGLSLGISDDGTRVVASTHNVGVCLYDIVNGVDLTTQTHLLGVPNPVPTITAISGNGDRVFFGDPNFNGTGSPSGKVFDYTTRTQVGSTFVTDLPTIYQRGVSFSTDGTRFITSAYHNISGSSEESTGYVEMRRYNAGTNSWVTDGNEFVGEISSQFGFAIAMSGNGLYACATIRHFEGDYEYAKIYKRVGNTFSLSHTITGVNGVGWGQATSMSNDGSTIIVSTDVSQSIYIYKRGTGVETYSLYNSVVAPNIDYNKRYFESVSLNKDGNSFFSGAGKSQPFSVVSDVNIFNYTLADGTPSGTVIPVPSYLSSTSTIESVKWIKDVEDAIAPTQNSLTGKNTALYSYYYCNSYNNFITMVNKTLKLAYKNFMESIYNNWIAIIGDSGITNQFLNIASVQYPTPPFIDWNETNLTADVYASMLFETYQTAANAVIANINYAMPETTWATGGGSNVGTPVKNTPLKFELAFNAPLYSLFSSLPATRKVITNSTGKREIYYTLDFYSSGLGLVTPSPALNSVIPYSFLTAYTNATTGVITLPNTNTFNYSHSRKLIKQSQEISTIDTWTPVNAIVFTTTSIPIIVNQFTASSSIGSNPPSSSLDNAFAFVITDLQSNQQGYRPNILLTPKIYRMIDLTGNQPLKNIDINVFWRTKTGNLVPFTLASGAMSSIKLLFQKKVLGENQQINMSTMNIRDLQ